MNMKTIKMDVVPIMVLLVLLAVNQTLQNQLKMLIISDAQRSGQARFSLPMVASRWL